jgi:hypothetical protein
MSTIRCDNFGPSAGGTTYSARGIAKAWVNFNGTGTIAARDSENVSSLTDVATGRYGVNFSNAFGAADYAVSGAAQDAGSGSFISTDASTVPTASAVTFYVFDALDIEDTARVFLNAHGDLA